MSFEAPSTGNGDIVKAADLHGHLLIISPTDYRTGIQTSLGDAEAIQCDVVDLDTQTEYTDVLFFNAGIRGGLKSKIGTQVLARIAQGIAKPGKSAPWILENATGDAADVTRATKYIAEKALGGLTQPATPAPATPAPAPVADANDPAVQALIAQLTAKA